MTGIAHVVVKFEPDAARPGAGLLYADAGPADTDDVLAAVEYGPVELAAGSRSGGQVRREDLIAICAELAAALRVEAGVVVEPAHLLEMSVVEGV